jgi:Zn-dependent M28 family amino/carboxypeptidase
VGSRYYANHPVFPLEKTIANLNLEHAGRTDDTEGSQKGKATFTGFRYSDVPAAMRKAAAPLGYDIYDRPNNEIYFDRSDNAPLAEAGVPAHTLVVAAEFPDYHEPGDDWDKLDYENMERLVEALAAGVLEIANALAIPRWSPANPAVERYRSRRK